MEEIASNQPASQTPATQQANQPANNKPATPLISQPATEPTSLSPPSHRTVQAVVANASLRQPRATQRIPN